MLHTLAWSRRLLAALTLATCSQVSGRPAEQPRTSDNFAVIGYLPDYRFGGFDLVGAVKHATHIILFSVECDGRGRLTKVHRLDPYLKLRPGVPRGTAFASQLEQTLTSVGDGKPRAKFMVSVGGAGRSGGFAQMAASKKYRQRFAREVGAFLKKHAVISGVDLDWEGVPHGHETSLGSYAQRKKWTHFAKVAAALRDELGPASLLSMTYRPLVADPPVFATLKGKKGRSFIDLFNFSHVMAYDAPFQHSTTRLARSAVKEWSQAGLPLGKLTLGLPFYGREDAHSGKAKTWGEIVDAEPELKDDRKNNTAKGGIWFNNADTLRQKVHFAMRSGLAGVMIWELGQDKSSSDPESGSLLRAVRQAVEVGPTSLEDLKKQEDEERRKREVEL